MKFTASDVTDADIKSIGPAQLIYCTTDDSSKSTDDKPYMMLSKESISACWNRLLSKHALISRGDVERLRSIRNHADRLDQAETVSGLDPILSRIEKGTENE